jgi:diguanylate cyclase (GGDEF)-like protein
MEFFRDKTVLRAIVLMAMVAGLICAILYLAWRGISLEQREQLRLNEEFDFSRAALQLKFRAADLNGWQRTFALDVLRGAASPVDGAARSRKAFREAAADFERQMKVIGNFSLTASEREQLRAVRARFEEFMQVDNAVVGAYQRGGASDKARASWLVASREMDLFRGMAADIDAFEQSAAQRAQQAARELDRAAKHARNALAAAGILALGLVGWLIWLVARSMMRNSALVRQLQGQAHTDGLTAVANRRAWDERLPRELEQARRLKYAVSVAIVDLDYFKKYNDERGHPAGDSLLKDAAAAFRHALRQGDLIARYGGEEFALLLPGASLGEAFAKIDQLRPLTPDNQTFSAGVAQWDRQESTTALVQRADDALYRAKRQGRNRTMASPPPSPVTANANHAVPARL